MAFAALAPFRTRKRTDTVAPISTAVTQTSPSPCAKCPSPVEKSPPSTATGRGGHAALAAARREVPIAGGEEPALDRDRQEELRALRQLLDVEVAAVLSRR